jgi:magnesium chelatase family protein
LSLFLNFYMPGKIITLAVLGLDCQLVEVEADTTAQNSAFIIVGLGDAAVQEAKERVRLAIKNSEAYFPRPKLIVNLAPADLKKAGPSFDLAIAVSILVSNRQIKISQEDSRAIFVGELSLNGDLRPINGIIAMMLFAKSHGFKKIYLPTDNAFEAGLIPGVDIFPVSNLKKLIEHLNGREAISRFVAQKIIKPKISDYHFDLSFVKGQEQAKRALEIAAAGGHNLIMSGSPGSGKTLLARTLPSILPPLTLNESLEVTKIYSISGLLKKDQPLIWQRPFRSPHHSASLPSLVGGGSIPKPGEITLAHRGVLFLDEFSEFPRSLLDSLRQPLEDRIITIARVQSCLVFPANFILVAAMNPCPCGYYGDPDKECCCTSRQIYNYRRKISGPLLDRIDLALDVPRVKYEKLATDSLGEKSALVRKRVVKARLIQLKRFKKGKSDSLTNSEMSLEEIKKYCQLNSESQKLLKDAMINLKLTARAYHRLLKMARTIADLETVENIETKHLAEALQYRPKIE